MMSVVRAAATIIVLSVATAAGIVIADLRDEPGSPMPLDDAYALMTEAMSRPGMVLHVTPVQEVDDLCVEDSEAWISEGGRAVRVESHVECEGGDEWSTTTLFVEGGAYHVDRDGKPYRDSVEACRETTLPGVMYFLQCGADRDVRTRARSDVTFDGRPAIRLHSKGELQGIDSRVTVDSDLYLDPETGLPIQLVAAHADYYGVPEDHGPSLEWVTDVRYRFAHIEQSSLGDSYFEPGGLGLGEAFPPSAIAAEGLNVDISWLGESLPGDSKLPGLTLKEIYPFSWEEHGDAMYLGYRLTDDEFGESLVGVTSQSRAFVSYLEAATSAPAVVLVCVTSTTLSLAGAESAVLLDRRSAMIRFLT